MHYSKFNTGFLRSPEGGDGGGGGEGHDSDAGALFGEAAPSAAPSATPPGDGTAQPPAKAGGEAAPKSGEPAKPKPGAQSVFEKVSGKKPTDGAPAKVAADAGKPADLPEDKIDLGDKASADTKTHFSNLKGIAKTLRTELATRDAKIAEIEKRSGSAMATPEVERLRAEHKAFSERIAVLDLQNHPDFIRQYVEPKTKLVAGLNTVLADNKVDGVEVASLLSKPRPEFAKAVSEIAGKLPVFEQAAFIADMRQLHTLDAESKSALGKSVELRASLATKGETVQKQAFEETWKSLDFVNDGLKPFDIPADLSPEEKAAYEAYNEGIGKVRTAAESIAFGRLDEKSAATVATKAATFDFYVQHAIPRMEAEFKKAGDLIQTLTAEIAALKGSRGSGAGSGVGSGSGAQENESHESALAKVW